MSIQLSDNIRVGQRLPLESKYYNGIAPWADVAAVTNATTGIASGLRFQGLTVNVDGVEYWFKDGIQDADLVAKGGGIGSGTTNIVPKWDSAGTALIDSQILDDGTYVRIGNGGGNMAFPYEKLILEENKDVKFGTYTSVTSFTSGGASYVLGYTKIKTNLNYYPGFEFQMSGAAVDANNFIRYNFIQRATDGTVAASNDDIFKLYADSRISFKTLIGTGNEMVVADASGFISRQTIPTGTVTGVTATTPLASTEGTAPVISIQQANGSQAGYLSSQDWTIFNGKQNALTNPVTGTGTQNFVTKWSATAGSITDSSIFDNGTSVGIGTNSPNSLNKLEVSGTIATTSGINLDTTVGTKTGLYSGGNEFTIWAGGNSLAKYKLVGNILGTFFEHTYGFTNNGSVASGSQNVWRIAGGVTATTVANTIDVTQLLIDPTYNQSSFGTGKLRGVYYNPPNSGFGTSIHRAWENTRGDIVHGNLAFSDTTTNKVLTVDSIGKLVNDEVVTNFVKYNDILTEKNFSGRTVYVSPLAMSAGLFSTNFGSTTQAQWIIGDTPLDGGVRNGKIRKYQWKNAYTVVASGFTGSVSGNILTITSLPPYPSLSVNMWIRLADGVTGVGRIIGGSGDTWTLNTTSTVASQSMTGYIGNRNVYSQGFLYFGFWSTGRPVEITASFKGQNNTTGTIEDFPTTRTATNISVSTTHSYWKLEIPVANYLTDIEVTFTPGPTNGIDYKTQEMVVNFAEGIDVIPFINKDGGNMYGTLSFLSGSNGLASNIKGSITNAGALTMATGTFTGLTTGTNTDMVTINSSGVLSKQAIPTGLPPSGTASGDLSGTYPSPTVVKIQGNSISNTTPTTNQVLQYNGSSWVPATVTSGGGLLHGTAAGTDTYTTTISGSTAYADGDAYLIRFTNGNTGEATLNISGLGAKKLYRNNDGILLGGDITSGGEMLCVYNSTLDGGVGGFQCIGISPNSLFAYVTNDDSVTITKGQPVYASGGTGDRMTVRLAFNTGDATSAQTIGLVFSASIAAGAKGLIMVQGLLDQVGIVKPADGWLDGDAVYLGATAGAITRVKPYAPNHLVYLGFVTTASPGNAGRIYVRIQNGYELDELHNVQAKTPNNKDTLWYDNSVTPKQWKTDSITNILGYTPIQRSVIPVSSTGTVAAGSTAGTDYVYIVSVAATIALPSPTSNTNLYTIKRTGAGLVTITTLSGNIDGTPSSININVQYVSLTLISDGTNWNII